MRVLRHQPLLIWTILVVVLVGLFLFGALRSTEPDINVAVPAQTSGGPQARELLTRAQGAFGALNTNELDVWARELARDLAELSEQYESTPQAPYWESAHRAADDLLAGVDAPRESVLSDISELQRSLIALARSYP